LSEIDAVEKGEDEARDSTSPVFAGIIEVGGDTVSSILRRRDNKRSVIFAKNANT
jgi:hypothetical protein